ASVICFVLIISTSNQLSLGAAPKQNYLDGLKHDDGIKKQSMVLNVEEIVLKLLSRIFDRGAVWVLNLRPTRQARRDQMPLLVERNLLGQLGHKMRSLGSGANEAHLTLQNVPKLGNLIDP